MSQVNKLYRNFIILQEDERGYSSSNDKTLSGYSKIEAKGDICKISFYAQNLRKDDDEYCILVICNKKDTKKIVNLGEINISDGGKAEITKEYNLDNIGGLGISYDKISGAAIGKIKNNVPIIIMCGFINGEQPSDSWKNYKVEKCVHTKPKNKIEYMKKDEKKKKHRSDEDVEKVDKVVEKIEERETDILEVEEIVVKKEQLDVDESEVRNDEAQENTEEVDNPFEKGKYSKNPFDTNSEENLYGIEDLNRGSKNKFDEYEEKLECNSNAPFQIKGSVGEYFEGLVNGFEQCRSKYEEIKYCKWYKIPVTDLHEMCNMSNYNRYAVAYYPMLNYYPYIRKYRHFMLGYKCDNDGNLRYIVYGVPGMKNKDDQPYEGKTGFVTWVSDEDRDGMGCWLMFYDFKNSTVVVPMQ